jgi:hypothetical protein
MDYFSDSMDRVHRLFAVAKGFAAKGVEKDDEPVWVAGTFAMLIELIETELDRAMAKIGKSTNDLPPHRGAP